MIKIHCPDCQTGILRNVTDIEEIKRINPFSRALPKPNLFWAVGKRDMFPSPTYVLMFCDKCRHFHDMDSRSLKNSKKPPSVKIKGYGIHYMRKEYDK